MTGPEMEVDRRVPAGILSETRKGAVVTVKDGPREYRGRVLACAGGEADVRLFEELPSRPSLPSTSCSSRRSRKGGWSS